MTSWGNWVDDEDDDVEDEGLQAPSSELLPGSTVEGPDEKGIKTYTSYRIHGGERQKVIRKVRVVTRRKKVSKRIKERRQLHKFGLAKDAGPGPEPETTIVAKEEVRIENPGEEAKAARRAEEALIDSLRKGRAIRQKNEEFKEKEANITGGMVEGKVGGLRTGTALSQMAAQQGGAAAMAASGKYVPLHLRPGASMGSKFDDDEQNTLRVTNISADTTEDDLRDLFSRAGRIQRVYLARDRETQESRGFAYISYYSREDAQKAMDRLNGFGYDHLILKVEWAKPSNREDAGSQNVMKHASGYGGALPQNVTGK